MVGSRAKAHAEPVNPEIYGVPMVDGSMSVEAVGRGVR